MKSNLPFKFCWLTTAILFAFCANSFSAPLKNRALSNKPANVAQMPVKGVVKDTTGQPLVGV